jgi:sulfite exporter TauE/SafE/copper chaperone CopZ
VNGGNNFAFSNGGDIMNSNVRTEIFRVSGMTCPSCAKRIEKKLTGTRGVERASVSYEAGTAMVVFDESASGVGALTDAIESLGYRAAHGASRAGNERRNLAGALILIAALYMIVSHHGGNLGGIFNFFPQAEAGMGYWLLFVTGVLTSVHCVAMCGGINLSQCLSGRDGGGNSATSEIASMRPAFLYNAGRVASYTAVGGLAGALGSVVSLTGVMKGAIQMAAGVFMVLMGLNMLGMFGFLRALTPRMPQSLVKWLDGRKKGKGPLIVGLLNGLMPCGPLQAMQLYAMGTGSPARGALAMLAFSLGTVPLMFGLGVFGSMMSGKFAGRAVKTGAALVMVMGVVMLNNGVTLSGLGSSAGPISASARSDATRSEATQGGTLTSGVVQEVTSELPRRGFPAITVNAGAPVRWNLHAEKGTINGCNNAIVIPEYKIEKRLQPGDNIIEFTPTRTGTFRYSCWMGMIRGTITVLENGAAAGPEPARSGAAEAAEPAAPLMQGCPCCGG